MFLLAAASLCTYLATFLVPKLDRLHVTDKRHSTTPFLDRDCIRHIAPLSHPSTARRLRLLNKDASTHITSKDIAWADAISLYHNTKDVLSVIDWAVTLNHLEVVKALIKTKPRIEPNIKQRWNRHIQSKNTLHKHPPPPGTTYGDLLLPIAAFHGHVEIVQLLLQSIHYAGSPWSKTHALATAVGHEHPGETEMVGLLLHSGANLRVMRLGDMALRYASAGGNLHTVRLLVEAGKYGQTGRRNRALERALQKAARAGQVEVVNFLLEVGAQPGWGSYAALKGAVSAGSPEAVWLLLEAEDIPTTVKTKILEWAVGYASGDVLGTVRELINTGAGVNGNGGMILRSAIDHRRLSAVPELLKAGADPLVDDPEGPLWFAVEKGEVDAVRQMLNTKARPLPGGKPILPAPRRQIWLKDI
ncbi:hypothetical protein HDV00_006471 [Rhizophlyctis rosea]|nr:hypothetical protein HDV00_006471 [Rhizophlyctis rosea]